METGCKMRTMPPIRSSLWVLANSLVRADSTNSNSVSLLVGRAYPGTTPREQRSLMASTS